MATDLALSGAAKRTCGAPASTTRGCDLDAPLTAAGIAVRPIPRLVGAGLEPPGQQIDRRRPVLWPALARGWRATRVWNPDYLAAESGEKAVAALMNLPFTGVLFPRDQATYTRTLPFAEFLTAVVEATAEAPCYLAYTRADTVAPSGDYDFAGLLGREEPDTDTRVWIGSVGTRSMLHSDLRDNLFCQIWGEKRVVLLPWEQSRAAYPFPDNVVNSQVDLADPDIKRFPQLKSATFYSATMEPGDVLYIPRGCWHDIRSLTPSISLNHWFGPPMALRDYARLLLLLGPSHWLATAVGFLRHGVLGRAEETRFFFSPPSTGKRFYDALRWGDFSRDNDPVRTRASDRP